MPPDTRSRRTSTETINLTNKRWTAAELRRLPSAERDAVLQAAADRADGDYRRDPELTGFDAFGKDDLYGDSADSATR